MEEDHVKTEVETRAWLYKLNSAKDLGVPETKKARKNPYLRPSVTAGSCQGLKRSPKNTFFVPWRPSVWLQKDFSATQRSYNHTTRVCCVSFLCREEFYRCWNLLKAQTSSVYTMVFHPDILLCEYFCSSVCFDL